jgi:hypothetical protein
MTNNLNSDVWVNLPAQPGRYLMRNSLNHDDSNEIIVEYVTWEKYYNSKNQLEDFWRIVSFDKNEVKEYPNNTIKKQILTVVFVQYKDQLIENNTPLETYHMYGDFNGYYGEYKLIEGY